jgi:hypothetical protein
MVFRLPRTTNGKDRLIYYSGANFQNGQTRRYNIVGTVENLEKTEQEYEVLTEPIHEGLSNGNRGAQFKFNVSRGEKGLVEKLKVGDRFNAEVRGKRAKEFELL